MSHYSALSAPLERAQRAENVAVYTDCSRAKNGAK